jgi:hypothetical protein
MYVIVRAAYGVGISTSMSVPVLALGTGDLASPRDRVCLRDVGLSYTNVMATEVPIAKTKRPARLLSSVHCPNGVTSCSLAGFSKRLVSKSHCTSSSSWPGPTSDVSGVWVRLARIRVSIIQSSGYLSVLLPLVPSARHAQSVIAIGLVDLWAPPSPPLTDDSQQLILMPMPFHIDETNLREGMIDSP